jgi:hypothetical protein
MAWKCLTSALAKKFRNQLSSGKIVLTLIRNMERAILVHSTPKGSDVVLSDFHVFGSMKEALRGR